MMKKLPLFALSLLSSSMLHAQNQSQQQTTNIIPYAASDDLTIVVTANKSPTALKNTPAAISSIGYAQLQSRKPTFIGQVLDQVAGVKLGDLSNEQHMTSIRQPMTTTAVYQFLEDGISIRPVGVFNHNALYETNLGGIERLEVMRGPASSLYGNNAVGGAINLITQRATQSPSALIRLQASDQGFTRVDANVGNTFDTSLGQQGLQLSTYHSQRDGGWQQHANGKKTSATLRHDWQINPQTSLKNVVSYNELYTDMTGSITQKQWDENQLGASAQNFTYRDVKALRVSSALKHQWSEQQQTNATVYFRQNTTLQNPSYLLFNDRVNPAKATGRITDNQFNSYGLNLQQNMMFNQVKLTLGLQSELTPTDNKETSLNVRRDTTTGNYLDFTVGNVLRDYNVNIYNNALYAQADWRFLPKWLISGGARYDQIKYQYENNLTPSATTGAANQTQHFKQTSPKLGVIYNATPYLDVYSNLSQGYVPPEVSSQFGASLSVPNLKAATFNNVDLGLRFSSLNKRVSGELGIYQLTGKNEQVSFTKPDNTREPRNAGQTTHQGIEFATRVKLSDVMAQQLNVTATYAKHEFDDYAVSNTLNYNGKTMPSAPRLMYGISYQLKPIEQLTAIVEYKKMGSYWMDNANTFKYKGHQLLDLRAIYQPTSPTWQNWQWFGTLSNVTNAKYAEQASTANNEPAYTAGAPRTWLIGLQYKY